jgi:hypothetical protein
MVLLDNNGGHTGQPTPNTTWKQDKQMRRITKVAAITATAITALIATAGAASASVNVTDGVGFVGKGDVQTALHLSSDEAVQSLFKAGGIKFTMGTETSMSNETRWVCGSGENSQTSTVRYGAATVTAVANTNNAGKLTNGWNLTTTRGQYLGGERTGAPYVGYCASGGFGGFLDNVFTNTGTTTGLKVNGVDLPNTPVEVAPVA